MGGLSSKFFGASRKSTLEGDARPAKRLRVAEAEFAKYDVFISHRGPDTKTGFVGFLFEDLKRAGLHPFLDCKSIRVGQDSWECIEHAIQRTPLAVVIFSESFAESEWCLRELHAMLACPSVKVIPIFYGVEPWEVKSPEKGRLATGFAKLKKSHEHDRTLIAKWTADLERASTISGEVHRVGDTRSEAMLVDEVVEKILQLANKPLPLDVGAHVFGHKEVAEMLIRTVDEKQVSVLGLWGMGGIGKSTLARELFNQLKRRFVVSCYVGDVMDKVETKGVVSVQSDIFKALCGNHPMENVLDESAGKSLLEERLPQMEVLVVLDDVHDDCRMGSLMSLKMLKEGSLCIVTSRDCRVFQNSTSFLVNAKVHTHEVRALSNRDSRAVLKCLVFGGDVEVPHEFEGLFGDVSKACGGVPLVLEVIGSSLKGKDVEIWREVLHKLDGGSIMDMQKVLKVLRSSYDTLERETQEIFLDIACALLGTSLEGAKIVWRSQDWSPARAVGILVERALITVNYNGEFHMHDLLRDMGREISKRDSSCMGKRMRHSEFLVLLNKDKPLPATLETLDIEGMRGIEVDLSCMQDLRILKWKSDFVPFSSLPRNLRWLKLWETSIKSLPASFGNLRMLEVLDLSGCVHYEELPNLFGDLKNLKYVNLERCRVAKLPDSFGDLKKLEVLIMRKCVRLTRLPLSFGGLQNLMRLDLHGSRIKSLPESFGRLHNLKYLDLSSSEIQSLPQSFGRLSNLEELNLEFCRNFEEMPNSFGCLSNLRSLNLRCTYIQNLPEYFGTLTKLEELFVSGRDQLVEISDFFQGLQKLRNLELNRIGIQRLPESIGRLSNLEVLQVNCNEHVEVPDFVGGLQKLRFLDLIKSQIERSPESIGRMSKWNVLHIRVCDMLVELPDFFGGLQNLRWLNLSETEITSLPESFRRLTNSLHLDVRGCDQLVEVPESLQDFVKEMQIIE